MAETNSSEILNKDILRKFPMSEKIAPKQDHIRLHSLLGELYGIGNTVKDESRDGKTEKVVLHGTGEETVHPSAKPFILRSGARAGCDASLLLEVADDGTAHVAVTHWEPTDDERQAHTDTVSRLSEQEPRGARLAVLVSGTIRDLREAEATDLYRKMIKWNKGRKPDLVYIPFDEGIAWDKIARENLYQLVFTAKAEDGSPQFEVSVPGTKYSKAFTPQTLPDALAQEVTSVKL